MNQHAWLLLISSLLFTCATEPAPDPALQAAALRSGDPKAKAWTTWHGHHHKRWPRCRKSPSSEGSSCGWSNYSEGLSGAAATLVFFDPRERGAVYADVGGELFRSSDSGETWSPRGHIAANITQLEPDGPDPSDLLAATGSPARPKAA
jgi:hypothetical protein